jgi:hypothetical protein
MGLPIPQQGVFLRRNVVNVAGRALKVNLQRLGPLVLPITEMVRAPSQLLLPPGAPHAVLACPHFLQPCWVVDDSCCLLLLLLHVNRCMPPSWICMSSLVASSSVLLFTLPCGPGR